MISEIITIDDDDPISEMKLNLQDSYLKYKKSVEVVDLSPSYSPTQSPALSLSPSYEAPGIDSPVASPPLVDLTSPYSPTDEVPSSPPLPPLPPPVQSTAPPPLPPPEPSSSSPPPPPLPPARTLSPSIFPDPVPTTSSHGEPLPPGEDLDPASPRHSNMDMDLDSGDDAEANFFLSQQNLFPASVWDFRNHSRPESGSRHSRDRASPEESIVDRKRKLEETEETESPALSQEENDEEEESLRLLLLAQVSKGRSHTESNKKARSSPDRIGDGSKELKEPTPKKQKKKKYQRKTTKKESLKKPGLKLKEPAIKSQRPKVTKISESDKLKFFPNLTRRVVINFTEEASDSEPEEPDLRSKNGGEKSDFFGIELEAFLKEARKSSKPVQNSPVKTPEPRRPQQKIAEKKIALTPRLKAQASKLTLETKKKLIDAKITHLSETKQKEYVRLKEIIEKKQKEKAEKKKSKIEAGKENVKRANSLGEDEEAALRESLLNNMKKKVKTKENTTRGEKSKNTPEDIEPSSKTDARKIVENISVEIVGENRDVRIEEETPVSLTGDEGVSPDSLKLTTLEKDVVGLRKSLSASLFKLSAYMSQLQKETSGVDSAVKYIEELKSQLNETEKLLATRKSKVENLKAVIRESHQQITTEKRLMGEKERMCREVGTKVAGDSYSPPVEGAENISKKLEMINNTAKKVKTGDTGLQGLVFSGNNEGLWGSGSGDLGPGNLTGDYRSPLEHLSQTNKTVIDHSKELCRFALSGKCLDDSCQLQHLPPS